MADNYKITGQTQIDDIGPTGMIVPAMKITFETRPSNVIASVTIPLTSYTVEEVGRVVGTQADTIERVHAL